MRARSVDPRPVTFGLGMSQSLSGHVWPIWVPRPEHLRRVKSCHEPCSALDTYGGSSQDKPEKDQLGLALSVFLLILKCRRG